MEADWSVALADDDAVLVVPWAAAADDARAFRFIDLRLHPELVDELEEAHSAPMRFALLSLNSALSPLWTAKCDFWTSSDETFDPYEMDAMAGETSFGAGCYLDLLPRDAEVFTSFPRQEAWMRSVTQRLRGLAASAARVDLVLRGAHVRGVEGFGISCFVQGCGGSAEAASQQWNEALAVALTVLLETGFEAMPRGDTMTETGE